MTEWNDETWAIRTQMKKSPQAEHSVPVYLTSSFTFEGAEPMRAAFADEVPSYIYSRFTNPNVEELVAKVCRLEGAESGHGTASGMAALFATIGALLQAGDHIVAGRAIFGTTHTLLTKWLPRFGIGHTLVDLAGGPEAFGRAITASTKMILVETPTNPGVEIADLDALAGLARERGLLLVVDNTFATPVLQKPLRHGAHLVFHSATKFMDGQGRVMGGVVVGPEKLIAEVRLFCRTTGPSLSAFDAWVISKGIETLAVRVERHSANALALAERLEVHPDVPSVRYPFLPSHPQHALARRQMRAGGAVVAFEVAGGLERGRRFLDALRLCSLTPNLGDTRTIATHPASTTHSKLTDEERAAVGITPGLVRVSVGLEAIEDVVGDVEQALAASG
jgi:O-succinylhomoserine sulfhydrylase